jgi:hypothetical protein
VRLLLAGLALCALALVLLLATVCAYWGIETWQEWLVYEQYGVAGPRLQGAVGALSSGVTLTGKWLPGGHVTLQPLGDFTWGSGSNTFCETYVEQATGIGNQGLTAADAAARLAGLGLLKQGTPPAGAIVYFGPSADNEFDGHVGIAQGGGLFKSVTVDGLALAPMAGWQAPYLGWVDPQSVKTDRFDNPVKANVG